MARQIYDVKINKIIDHNSQIRELYLTLQDAPEFNFKAGQFMMIHVPTESGKPALRAYSIASGEQYAHNFKLIFKFVEKGIASEFIWKAQENEALKMTGPFGKVFFQEPPTEQIVFLNTGSGLSQHFCFLESKMNQYPDLKYRLLFGVRTEADCYYQKELGLLKNNLKDFHYEYVLSRPSEQWAGKKGYVQHFIKDFDYKNITTTFYLCGNGGMIKEVKHQLLEIDGLDKNKVWSEAFD